MPHDECVRVQVVADETYDSPAFGARNVFRFWAKDRNGKDIVSPFYAADSMANMYTFADAPLEWVTHDNVNTYRRNVRKALGAKRID